MEFFWLICGAQEQVTRSAFCTPLVHSTIKLLIPLPILSSFTFYMSADSMHFSQTGLWAGVLSLLQATTARPVADALPQSSTVETNTANVNTLDGEVVSNGNGTRIQTFPNTTTGRSGTN